MVNETKKKTSIIVIIVALIVILAILGGFIGFDIYKNNKNNKGSGNGSGNTSTENVKKAYNEGATITLTDGSKWYALFSSKAEDETILLYSVDNINTDNVSYSQAANYLTTTFRSKLVKGLGSAAGDIKDIRLLTLDEISTLSRIEKSDLKAGAVLQNDITSVFVYESNSLIDGYESGLPLLICQPNPEVEANPGRICVGTQEDVFPIRAVLEISKKYIKN